MKSRGIEKSEKKDKTVLTKFFKSASIYTVAFLGQGREIPTEARIMRFGT
jgi:hypothetical protein